MALTYSTSDATTGSTIAAADINSRFDDIKSKFNGGVVNGDISNNASISISKLDANYEHMLVNLHVGGVNTTDYVWPAVGTVVRVVPLPDDGKGNWTVTAAELVCNDVGADDAQVRIDWGRYTSGTWGATSTVVSSVAINSDDSSTDTAGHQTLSINTAALAAGTHRCLAMVSGAAGTNTILTADTSFISVSLHLKRQIANG
jgi:hypothetical protein